MAQNNPALGYWKQYLKDAERCTFPTINDNWTGDSDDEVSLEIEFGPRSALDEFTRQTRLSVSSVIQAAWTLVLRSYVGADAVCFGVRHEQNVLPFVAEVRPQDTCLSFLGEIQSWSNKCAIREPCELSDIETALNPGRRVSLFNTALCLESHPTPSSDTKFDVEIKVDLETATLSFDSRRSIISIAQAENVTSTLQQVLRNIFENPRCLVSDVPLFTDRHAASLDSWSNGDNKVINECAHDAIFEHFRNRPDALALSSWDEGEWSYRVLEEHINALANVLIGMKVNSAARVALLFTKSAWSVVAMMAILKIGATVVPLEPSQPIHRLKQIMGDADVELILASKEHSALLHNHVERILTVERETLSKASQRSPDTPKVSTDALAWILSTSGSTGQPKGVMITHKAFATAFHHILEHFKLDSSARVLQFSSFSYIISLFEVFSALVPGGCLAIPSLSEKEDNLAKCLKDWNINFTILTPSILKEINPEEVLSLGTVAAAGEPMRPDIIRKWSSKVRLINLWGSTESLVVAVSEPMQRPSQTKEGGHCLGHCRVVEPGNHDRRVPIGAVGEMIFQAPWISEGYVKDVELTTKVFLKGDDNDSARWYKTGDLVRQNSDGSLIIAGRKDSMVKLRGQRINLPEISLKLSACADESLVFVPTEGPCQQRLVAAVALKSHRSSSIDQDLEKVELLQGSALEVASSWVDETKALLLLQLPSYMVPTVWLMLSRMPLTASRKMDRMAITRFVSDMSSETFDQVASLGLRVEEPVTMREKAIQAVWSSVLKISPDRIPRNQSFLALGGDSLTAMSVRAQCKMEGMDVSVQDILRYGTIMELATRVSDGKDGAKLGEDWQELRNDIQKSIVERGLLLPSQIEDAYPCTPVQQGMLLSQYRGSDQYDVTEIFEQASGELSSSKIRSAWKAVVARHPALRTVFFESTLQGGFFDQAVLSDLDPQVTIVEYVDFDVNMFVKYPPKSPDGRPAHDLTVFQGGGKTHLRFHIHHTLIDGSSMGLILRDFAAAYDDDLEASTQGEFGDYVGHLNSIPLGSSIDYWAETLEGIEPCCIPKLVDDVSPSNHLESISTELQDSVKILEFCKSEQITLPSLLRTVWACVLSVYTSSEDVCFGYLTSGRDILGSAQDTVGPFINMLVCKVCVDARSILGVVRSEQEQYLKSLAHQHCSLAEIRHSLGLSTQHLFNTSVSMLRSFTADWDSKRTVQPRGVKGLYPTEFDVSIVVQTSDTSIRVDLSHWTGSISKGHALHLLNAFAQGIASAVSNSEASASKLDMVRPQDFAQMTRWNQSHANPIESCVHDLIAAQCIKTPDATAIESWDGSLTFSQLDKSSNIIANALVALGVEPECHVILCSEKRLLAIVSIVAVLKAGGSVVCVDPANPKARTQKIVHDTLPVCILTSALHQKTFEGFSERVLVVDEVLHHPSAINTPVHSPVQPHNSALVLFTSGSTGVPKGIIHEHRAITTSLFAHCEQLHINSKARVLQFSAFTFDASFTETFTALIFGGCLVVPSEEERLGDLESVISRHAVNWAILTPTVVSTLNPDYIPTLRNLVLTGELLKESNVATWSGCVNLMNLYGPAEIMHATTTRLGLKENDRVRDIGRGTAVSTWIVDPKDPERLMPIGAVGELVVEGPILAREYLKDPVTTADTFIRAPKWRESSARFYRTGDLVHYNSDGSFYLVGRRDTQVKLHGQRIELEELEFQLKQGSKSIDGLGDSAVVFRRGETNQSSDTLAAVVEVKQSASALKSVDSWEQNTAKLAELKRYITEVVPQYMVPSLWIPIDLMPLLTSGKLDRKVLATMAAGLSQTDARHSSLAIDRAHARAPFTWMQGVLATLWKSVLNFSDIAADDHFFRLGGDSVAAMRLSALAREENLAISVASIFQNPTLVRMATSISLFSERSLQKLQKQYGLHRTQIQDIYPCTTTQTGLVLSSVAQKGTCISHYVYDLSEFDVDLFGQAWKRFQANSDILRTIIVDMGGVVGHVQVLMKDSKLHIEEKPLEVYLQECKQRTFEYGQPLSRACIVKGEGSHFVWTAHQSIYDHRSLKLIFETVSKIYRQLQDGVEAALESSSYRAYVDQTLECNVLDAADYWKRFLFNPDLSRYPAISHGSSQLANSTLNHSISLPTCSPNLLRGAWALLLSKYAGYSDHVVFGVTNDGGESRLLGPTITITPLVVSFYGGDTVGMLLERINEACNAADEYRHFGLQNIKMLSSGTQEACNFGSLLSVGIQTDLKLQTIPAPAHYPITLECLLGQGTVDVTAQFDRRVVPDEQMQRMLWQLAHIIRQMQKLELKLDEIEAISSEDANNIRQQNSLMPRKERSTIHDIISQQILAAPTAQALCSRDESISYFEMGEHSERLASYLQTAFSIRKGSVVPITFSRSPWAIISMLAISKLGGIFLPLDPSYPVGRLRQIIDTTEVSMVLCSPDHEELAQSLSTTFFSVDGERVAAMPLTVPTYPQVAFDDIAYLIYTSGSTGKPKGIPVEHGAFCTAGVFLGERLNLNSQSRAFHFASYAFDASLADSLIVLVKGGCVCIPSESDRLGDTAQSMRDLGVNWADFTPSFVRTIHPSQVPRLKTLVLGGEKMGLDNVELWSDLVRLVNVYGPAETCFATATHAPVRIGDPPDLIGTSCVGSVWIADPTDVRKLAPVGCIGELVIEGPAVGRGYLDQSRTEEVFVANPRWLSPSANGTANGSLKPHRDYSLENQKVYKTGDLGRYDLSEGFNGRIRIVGRKDTQVKIRGQRVELGDIEQHIKSGIPHAKHVTVEQVSIGSQEQIAAFICLEEEASEDFLRTLEVGVRREILSLENTLRERIPSYMIPRLYVLLSQMPRSASGKTDRNKLREIVSTFTHEQLAHYSLMDVTRLAPDTETEKLLASAWASTLNVPVESIGKEDSFFKLGGDSIAVLRMTTAARAHQLQLTVAQVFKEPRLDQLALAASFNGDSESEIEPFSLVSNVSGLLSHIETQYDIRREEIDDVLPVTPLQEGLMLLSLKTPGAYVSQTVLTLQPNVNLERFQLAWKQVAQRNAMLRTTIIYSGQSIQVVRKEQFEWQETQGNIDEFLVKDKERRMRHGDPMTRYAIVKGDVTSFVLTAHHSLYDGWSMKIVFEDVDRLYNGHQLPPNPQFSSFISHLANSDTAEKFWLSQFEGKNLATYPDPRAAVPEAETRLHHYVDVTRPNSDVTMSNILRAAWSMVVAKHANTQDVYFGAVLMGRNAPLLNIERMTGPTITTIPLCVSIDPNQTVRSFLHAIKDQSINMIPYEHTGLQNIKNMSAEANIACNFQNLLVIQPADSDSIESNLWNEKAVFARGEMVTLTYSLIVECRLSTSSIRIGAQYRASEIPPAQIERLLYQFETVLRQLNEGDPETLLKDISVCSPQDLDEIKRWNTAGVGVEECIHHNIEAVVAAQPERAAVASWDEQFTYSELNTFANKVAHRLRSLGVGPEVLVPLCFDKSAWAIVAMLAVLKAGGAYYCLDPKHPMERKEAILKETHSQVILVGEQYAEMYGSVAAWAIGSDAKELPLGTDPLLDIKSSNTAFLVFTSGSTGVPKGIVMEHGAFCSGAREHCKALKIGPESRVMQFANYTYDVSMGEIFSTLMQGGCVCVPSEEERLSGLDAAINRWKANWMFLTPTVAAFLKPVQVPTLKHLVLGGEHCTHENIQTWSEQVCLINSYGPAECAIWCACHRVSKGDDPSNLGKPIAAKLWILDADDPNQLAPIGAIGELAVEGPTLARGYWNDPQKTANAFITRSNRLYRTADLVRYGPEGSIHIVGRKDHQVKLHGQRIELGEIEHHLSQLMPEYHSVVEMFQPPSRNSTLAAFVSSRVDMAMPVLKKDVVARVQERLETLLPAHMTPTAYIPVELPMTAGGKVDRAKLRGLGECLSAEQLLEFAIDTVEVREVTTDAERSLKSFWAQVLHYQGALGKDSNFFKTGGDSISAMRLSAAARQKGLVLSVQAIFSRPKLENMAIAMTTSVSQPSVSKPQESAEEGVEYVMPATDYQRWTIGCNQLKTRGYLNLFTYNIKGNLDMPRLRAACQQVISKHPILRTKFVPTQDQLLQVVVQPHAVKLYFEQVSSQSEAIDDGTAGFDSQIVRFYLCRVMPEEHILLMRISHAQYDGISFPLISEDIKRAYSGDELSPTTPFAAFVQVEQPKLPAESFFTELLAGARMTEIVAHHRPSFAASVNQSLKRNIAAPMHLLSEGITFATIIKAAWAVVLSQLGPSTDVTFGQVSSGRNTAIDNIETIVGPCMNLLPVRVDTARHSTFSSLMGHLQSQHLEMIPFENLGFQHIIEKCTDWLKWTRFSSILQHTNFNIGIEEAETRGDTVWQVGGISPEHDVCDIWIWTGPDGSDFYIDFTYSSAAIPLRIATQMLDLLCDIVDQIVIDASAKIPKSDNQILPLPAVEIKKLPPASMSDPAILSQVKDVWSKVFGEMLSGTTEGTPYFDIRGDLVAAAQLATEYQKQGYPTVCVEDIIQNPSISDQYNLLEGKI